MIPDDFQIRPFFGCKGSSSKPWRSTLQRRLKHVRRLSDYECFFFALGFGMEFSMMPGDVRELHLFSLLWSGSLVCEIDFLNIWFGETSNISFFSICTPNYLGKIFTQFEELRVFNQGLVKNHPVTFRKPWSKCARPASCQRAPRQSGGEPKILGGFKKTCNTKCYLFIQVYKRVIACNHIIIDVFINIWCMIFLHVQWPTSFFDYISKILGSSNM